MLTSHKVQVSNVTQKRKQKIRKALGLRLVLIFGFVLRIVARAPSVEDDCERRERGEENRQ